MISVAHPHPKNAREPPPPPPPEISLCNINDQQKFNDTIFIQLVFSYAVGNNIVL